MSTRFEKITPTPPPAHEIVRDALTGLEWSVEFSAERLTFAQAEAYIAELNAENHLGYRDWRFPSRVELLSIVDDTRHSPAIDTDAFPGTASEWFWTATPYAADPKSYAWVVRFSNGHSCESRRGYTYRVRAVRGPARQFSASLERAA